MPIEPETDLEHQRPAGNALLFAVRDRGTAKARHRSRGATAPACCYTSIDPDLQRIAYEIVDESVLRLSISISQKDEGESERGLGCDPSKDRRDRRDGRRARLHLANQFQPARPMRCVSRAQSLSRSFIRRRSIPAYDSRARGNLRPQAFSRTRKRRSRSIRTATRRAILAIFLKHRRPRCATRCVKSKNVITVDIAMRANVGKVMNLANKGRLSEGREGISVDWRLSTAEATPLQVATAYTMFANLGDRVAPMPITRSHGRRPHDHAANA